MLYLPYGITPDGVLTYIDQVPLGTWANRGTVELYFKHRYRRANYRLGSLTEYFLFADVKPVLRDLRRMKPKVMTPLELEVLG